MPHQQNDPRFVYMKQEDVLTSSGFCNILKDRWFLIHPDTGDLIFWQPEKKRQGKLIGASPQCNTNRSFLEQIKEKSYPWASIKFFERVACPIDLKDYT